ncbi:Uncharacterized protein LW93_12093 [Fusarium fujikuroi]|nr:Uncharacterized protein LW93_12093 [Fusarium fujikuroi]
MAPITAIIDKTSANDSVIKLFYATGKAQLGLALWSGTKDADPEDPIQTPQEVGNGQYILNPSQMASINSQGIERVFALTTDNPFKVTRDDFYNISEISESKQKRLVEVLIGNTTLASCGNGDSAWVYYSRASAHSFEAGTAIASTGDMQRNTPVAVAFDNGKVFLYYCGRGAAGGIRRTIRTNNTWGSSELIDSRTISQDSQLTVVRANGINHLFFVARDQNEEKDDYFVHYPDEIS